MTRRLAVLVPLMLVLSGCADSGSDAPQVSNAPRPIQAVDGQDATVERVDDGDSLVVKVAGSEARVRLIGVNAPEQGECFGDVARSALIDRIEGRRVVIEADVEDVDQFGRLLRYVWLDTTLINEELAALGLVVARPFEPNITRQAVIDAAGQSAQINGVGMWAADACGTSTGAKFEVVTISANPAGRDEENLTGEFIVFVNRGSSAVDLTGFTLRDGSSAHRYVFPDSYQALPDVEFAVVVGCGDNTNTALYWCNNGPVWDNRGDDIFLSDPSGNIVLHQAYDG